MYSKWATLSKDRVESRPAYLARSGIEYGTERGPRLLERFRYRGIVANISLYRHGANACGLDPVYAK